MATEDTNVTNLIINTLTKDQYREITPNENEIYLVEENFDPDVDLSSVAFTGEFGDLINRPTTLSGYGITDAYTKNQINNLITSTYKAAGSISTVTELGSLDAAHEGFVYNMTADFITTSNFVEGPNKSYSAGTNVVIVNTNTIENPIYKYDVLGNFVDLSGYQLLKTSVTHPESTAVGNTTTPVYINNSGVATALSYSIAKSVPADAVFTDTTYSVFTGATSESPGSSGLVPKPQVGDQNKVLCGSGQWIATSSTDTLNTAGATDTSSKIFLVGATSQGTNPQTYSHDTVFVDTNGQLNSINPNVNESSTVVATTKWVTDKGYLTQHQDISGKQNSDTAVTHPKNNAVGSVTKPVYVASNGVVTECSYTIGASVPSNAVFTDTNNLVTQNVSVTNGTYPILLTPTAEASVSQGEKTTIFASGVTVNPSTSTINATTFNGNITGNVTGDLIGTATIATKLGSSNVGTSTQPIYLNGGVPYVCTYTLGKSVPSDAKFTDTTYNVFTGATDSSNGSTGLVPKPNATDNVKFLRGDSTWQTIPTPIVDQTFSGSSTRAQSGVAIQGELTTNYQPKLVSGTSIKSINNTNLLGSGNIDVLQNTATGTDSLTILGVNNQNNYGVNIGVNSQVLGSECLAIGNDCTAGYGNTSSCVSIGNSAYTNGQNSVAIGNNAVAENGSIQIGKGTNNSANTLSIGLNNTQYQLLDGTTGFIPFERINAVINVNNVNYSNLNIRTWVGTQTQYDALKQYYEWGYQSATMGYLRFFTLSLTPVVGDSIYSISTDNSGNRTSVSVLDTLVEPRQTGIYYYNGSIYTDNGRDTTVYTHHSNYDLASQINHNTIYIITDNQLIYFGKNLIANYGEGLTKSDVYYTSESGTLNIGV